ncbi:MAG: DUF4249 family protein [Saprospiraceae bacterium]|nr:DUF4249 family protein [Saprospiraceae bacterium]
MSFKPYFILFLALFGAMSCSNEFDLIEDKIETPIVYSLLDYEAPYQYVRLERAFASPDKSALELAKNPDSLYYKNAVVSLIVVRNGGEQTFNLEEVDGNDLGYPREDGVFATAPNKLYRINSALMNLVPGLKVKLRIDLGDGTPVTAETTIIIKPVSSFPRSGTPVAFSPTLPDVFRWNHIGEFGGSVFNLQATMHYTEVIGGNATEKTLTWPIAKNLDKVTFTTGPGEFYNFIGSNIEKNTTVTRFFDGLDYSIISGDVNLYNFLLVGQANTGITGSGELPTYTNLSRGLGIFGSKAVLKLEGLGLAPPTINELKNNKLTKDLNFQ